MPEENFLINRFKSVWIAARGVLALFISEGSIKIQTFIALVVTLAGFYYNISATEWMLQLLAIGLVMGVEGVNTAIEKLSDYVQPEYDERIGKLKDMSAGAVMITSVMAAIIGFIIYLPKVF